MTIKFSQFLNGAVPRTTDIVVGLRDFSTTPLNERFNFTGVADTDGNNIVSWSSAGALAVNYLDFKNSLTTLGPTIAAVGTDAAINLNIGGKGNSSYTQFLGTRAIAVPAGTTAEELTGIVGGLRYDTDTDYLRYWDIGANAWVNIIAGAAFDDATYVTNTDETANLPNSQPLSALASGLMFVTTTTGIVSSIALPLGATNGGTGQSTYALGDTLYSSAANTLSKLAGNITTAKQFLSQTGTGAVSAAPVWATISGGDITGAALTRTDDTNVTLTLGGSPSTALLNATSITAGWAGQLSLTRGGTNASLTASNGGIVYSTATAMAILSGTATANQMLQSGASGAPSWSTATWPSTAGSAGTILRSNGANWVNSTATFADTYTASNLLYSNGANTVTGLATANSAALVTSSTGAPVWSSTMTNGQIIIGSTGATPVAASLTPGSGVTITPGAGTITIAATASGTGSSLTDDITQVAHGFSVGDIVYLNGATYTLAIATSAAAAEAVGIVSAVAGVDDFTLTTSGLVTGLSGLTAGDVYWLSDTVAGELTSSVPATPGYIDKPLFVASSTTAGYFINYRGNIISPGPSTTSVLAVQEFSGSGTYTPTPGMVNCIIETWGGGGGGGGCGAPGGSSAAGGGGGSGGYSRHLATAADIGASKTVTIGAAGTAGASAGAGGAGGDTSVGSLCIGKGGSGGSASATAGLGGVAGTGNIVTGTGQSGVTGIQVGNTQVGGYGGGGGSSSIGGGGASIHVQGAAVLGKAGTGYGSGGGAGASYNYGGPSGGGAGTAGYVIITEYA